VSHECALSLRPLASRAPKSSGRRVRPFDAAYARVDRPSVRDIGDGVSQSAPRAGDLAAFGAQFGVPADILDQYRHGRADVSYITNVDKAGGIDRWGDARLHWIPTRRTRTRCTAASPPAGGASAKGGTMFADIRRAMTAA